jgi:Mlc titration factor MtfA (ptsG expression regulator)
LLAWPTEISRRQLAVATPLGVTVAALSWRSFAEPLPALALGTAFAILYYWLSMRRYLVRRRLQRQPFPVNWRATLERCVAFYRELDEDGRARFEDDVRFFIAEQQIYGPRGQPVDDEVRVLIGASAATLGHGMPKWEWPRLRDIVVYPTAFDHQYQVGDGKSTLGMVHAQGPVLFSAQDLKLGFCGANRDAVNVGLHELAHVMDFEDGAADGVPAGISWVATAPWVTLIADRLRQKRARPRRGALRAYAAKNEAELFAVAVEAFFENPVKLKKRDNELYEMLARYFNQDPAAKRAVASERDIHEPHQD